MSKPTMQSIEELVSPHIADFRLREPGRHERRGRHEKWLLHGLVEVSRRDQPTCDHGLLKPHETGRDKHLCPGPVEMEAKT